MAKNVKVLVYPTKDLNASKAFFNIYLDAEPYAESPYYVGYKPTNELEIGLDPHGSAIIAYIDVDDIQASLKTLQDAGATMQQEPKDVGGGLLIAQVKDVDGNVLGLRQAAK